ncbi:hypothetical protein QOZ80_8AG0622620 [Eleusine coracana subsp. coracana]|nr:hypothetical protein QOZ80_8AG0622620 [Eleusine coracana subsp. coracana]
MGNIMAAAEQPAERVESRCVPQTARGTLSYKITGYRQHKSLDVGCFIRSPSIKLGGYSWCLRYYPNGDHRNQSQGYIGVYLELLSKNTEARVMFDIRLIDPTTMSSSMFICLKSPIVFSILKCAYGSCYSRILRRHDLEMSPFLLNDSLLIECDITVIKEPQVVKTLKTSVVKFPRPLRNLRHDLANLLETKDEADVIFDVQGQVFPAHTIVLAMRSAVFKEQLWGRMRQQGGQLIVTIEDMQPVVFKALLHFIYTDSLSQCLKGLTRGDKIAFTKNLLVAADRYDVEKLKFECETCLCGTLDVPNAAALLALAEQHNCSVLKEACSEFITCPDNMANVVASEGYSHLKESCPDVLVDLFGLVERHM